MILTDYYGGFISEKRRKHKKDAVNGGLKYMVDTGRLGELIRRDVGWCLYASARKGSWKRSKIISTGNLKEPT